MFGWLPAVTQDALENRIGRSPACRIDSDTAAPIEMINMSAEIAVPEVARVRPRGVKGRKPDLWVVADPTIPGILSKLPDAEVIPLPVVRELAGWDRDAQSDAVKEGLIRPIDQRGKANCYQVTRDDAALILVAAVLAFAAGVAVIAMLRGLQGAGLDAAALARAVT